MKKLIILFLILSILIVGCKSYAKSENPQPTQSPSPTGGGCNMAESENQEQTKIKYVGVEVGL